jgi:plastocyanin
MNADSEKVTQVLKDPADGDIHGGVFVQYSSDGKGGVIGEVVADYAGLHGSALAAQVAYVAAPSVTIALNGSGFLQKSLNVPMNQSIRVTVKNVAGTSSGRITFDSVDLGITGLVLTSGQSKEIIWKAPAKPQDLTAKTNKTPNGDLKISVIALAPVPAQAPGAATTGPREIALSTSNFLFDQKTVEVKAGEAVKFTLKNGDDEKHNLVATGNINLISPDVAAGTTGSFTWTAPSTPGTYKVLCAYHPQMTFDLVIK